MSIQVVCPNGHSLHVKEDCAGKTGLCPICKARIQVPRPAREELDEDAILGIIGPYEPGRARSTVSAEGSRPWLSGGSPPKKSCDKCNREIDAATHICPFCHTYIAGLKDF
ncbi:MAG: hypothetical protein HUU20_23905 [Pirellulales bacterium]|nr:hypothetical protein [Pirellulales bacterium]